MPISSVLQLIMLAAIWGASFIFMRMAAGPIGPAAMIEGRVLFAALTLLLISILIKRSLTLKGRIKHYLVLGFFNTGFPFLLFAYAAQTLNASSLAIINATAPLWAALIAYFYFKTALSLKMFYGLILGIVGVSVLVGWEAVRIGQQAILPIIAALLAAACYGLSTNYAKHAQQVGAYDNAHGSMWAAVIVVLPFLFISPLREMPSIQMSAAVMTLGILCTGIAYLLYFKLVADVGPASALSVTFLVPIFGIIWGAIFLNEVIGVNTIIGSILVIIGTMLVTGARFFTFKKQQVE